MERDSSAEQEGGRMKVKKDIFVYASACLFIFAQPLLVYADKCDDTFDKAKQIFSVARTAAKQEEYEKAAQLYEEAGRYFLKASKMKNCRCPKIESSGKNNVTICKENAARSRKTLEGKRKYEEDSQIFETYNQAAAKFNEGNSYARNQQWELAVNSFEEANLIWRGIATTDTENGRRAQQAADQAVKLAELARQKMRM